VQQGIERRVQDLNRANMMKNIFLFFLLTLSVCSRGQIPAQVLPDFEFYHLDNSKFSNKDLPPRQNLLFVFFDSDCEHCQLAAKNINQQYKSFETVSIYFISLDSSDKIRQFMATYAPQLKMQKNVHVLRDRNNQFISKFKPRRYPSMFLYSAEKNLLDYEDNEESVFRIVNLIKKESK
jgi:peroxiredoxin